MGWFIFLEMRKQRQLKALKLWNSHWYALLNRCIYDTWTIFPGTVRLNLFSHNGSLHHCSWLAKLWPSTLEAPGFNPNWLGKQNAPRSRFLQLPSGRGSLGKSHPPGGKVLSERLAHYSVLVEGTKESSSLKRKKGRTEKKSLSLKLAKPAAIFFVVAKSGAPEFLLFLSSHDLYS